MTKRQFFNQGQEITSADLNAISDLAQQSVIDLLDSQLGSGGFYNGNFKVFQVSSTTVRVSPGIAIYVPFSSNEKFLIQHDDFDAQYSIAEPHATLPRYDLVQVRPASSNDPATATRNIKSSLGAVTPQAVPIRKLRGSEIQIKTGTASATPEIPDTDEDWISLAVLYVAPAVGIDYYTGVIDTRTPLANTELIHQPNELYVVHDYMTPVYAVSTVANVGGNLEISKTVSGVDNYADSIDDSLFVGMYWEMMQYLNAGYCIKIQDGSGYDWVIEPDNPMWNSYHEAFVLSGGGLTTRKLTIQASEIGSSFKLYRSLIPYYGRSIREVTSFAGFIATEYTYFMGSNFQICLFRGPDREVCFPVGYGSGDYAYSMSYQNKKPFWIRSLVGANYPGWGIETAEAFFKIPFKRGYRYRVTFSLQIQIPNTFTATIGLGVHNKPAWGGDSIFEEEFTSDGSAKWIRVTTDFIVSTSASGDERISFYGSFPGAGASFPNPPGSSGGDLLLDYFMKWGAWPYMIIEEL